MWRWTFRLGRDPIAVLTLLLFVLGGVQVEISRKTARRQLRAYVVVELGGLKTVGAGAKPVGKVNIYNVGQTPAYSVTIESRFVYAVYGRDASVDVPRGKKLKVLKDLTIGPSKSVGFATTGAEPTEQFMTQFFAKEGAIFLVGVVCYRDVFNRRHTTQFCRYPGPSFGVGDGEYYDGGNRAT